jgi:hypothetical protein
MSNWKWRIGTSEARSVLPICPLCWIYQIWRYYRGRVRKNAKGSLARPRAVTGLTAGARLQPVGQQWKESTLLPPPFSLLPYSPAFTPSKTVNTPSPLSSTSLSPMEIWRFNQGKVSWLEAKGSSKAPLHIPLQVIWIQLEFFSPKVFKSSFCPISLHGAKIWISFGRTSSEIT